MIVNGGKYLFSYQFEKNLNMKIDLNVFDHNMIAASSS